MNSMEKNNITDNKNNLSTISHFCQSMVIFGHLMVVFEDILEKTFLINY